MSMPSNIKIVYSLRIHAQLQLLGFECLGSMQNPKYPNLTCWMYEQTDEFTKIFNELIEDGGKQNGRED